MPVLDKMLEEQEACKGTEDEINWTPAKAIHHLGKEINDEGPSAIRHIRTIYQYVVPL